MTDVFVTTLAEDEDNSISRIRKCMLAVVMERWCLETEKVGLIECPNGQEIAFQRERRIAAEQQAESQFYVLSDDDCLLETCHPHLERAVEIMRDHPDFAMISWLPINCDIVPWNPPEEEWGDLVDGTVYDDDEIMEHVNVGGIRLIRKGAMLHWPDMDEGSKTYDQIHCSTLRDAGWRSGYFKTLRQLHLGRHYSMIWNQP